MALSELRIREIVAQTFDVPLAEVDASSSCDTVPNWDSLGHLRLILALEHALDSLIEPEDVVEMLSVEEIRAIVEKRYERSA